MLEIWNEIKVGDLNICFLVISYLRFLIELGVNKVIVIIIVSKVFVLMEFLGKILMVLFYMVVR